MERPLGSGDSAPPCAGVKGEDNPHGLSSLLNSLLSFFHGCKALALPQGRFTAFAPARSARKVGRAFHLPPICCITVSATASTQGGGGWGGRRLLPPAHCYARMDRFGQAVSVFPLSRSNLRANRAPATASVFFSERSRSEIGTAQPFRPPACASGKRGDGQEGRNRRFLPSCPPAPRRRSFPAFAKAETHALPLRSPIAIYKFPVFLIFTY